MPAARRRDPTERFAWHPEPDLLGYVHPATRRSLEHLGTDAWATALDFLYDETTRRPCDPAYAPEGAHTAFADGFPLLVTSEGSLEALNLALEVVGAAPVPMSRFRPNLVLSGAPEGAEDRCRGLLVGEDVRLDLVKPCDRCVVTTIDQASGVRTGPEPLATLGRVRRNPRTKGAWFGQNAVPRLPGGAAARLRVGAACRLVEG